MIEDGIYKKEATNPFVCHICKGFWECDVVIKGFCVCPCCEPEIYNQPATNIYKD